MKKASSKRIITALSGLVLVLVLTIAFVLSVFAAPDESALYERVDAFGNSDSRGEYLLFGSYPASQVKDTDVLSALSERIAALPTAEDSGNWTGYGYYMGTGSAGSEDNSREYMWYIDVTEGTEKYRGVYFESYRPTYTYGEGTAANTAQDENGYETGNVYWFKFESIKWRILCEDGVNMLLLADMELDSQSYSQTSESNGEVPANSYRESSIRQWLTEEFFGTAFTEAEGNIINTTAVKNDSSTTNVSAGGTNPNASENTNDKVFLLSYSELGNSEYGFAAANVVDTKRQKAPTDYAKCQGADASMSGWLTRSPASDDSGKVSVVLVGQCSTYVGVASTSYGIVPAVSVTLPHEHSFGGGCVCDLCGYVKHTFTADDNCTCGAVMLTSKIFPDSAFLAYVSAFDTDGDNILSPSELSSVSSIDIDGIGASDLSGIEHFTDLISLSFSSNNVETVALESNSKLQILKCSDNRLTSLNVMMNSSLAELDCSGNLISAINLSSNTKLKVLDISDNRISHLSLSQNTALESLAIGGNSLAALSLSANDMLSSFDGDITEQIINAHIASDVKSFNISGFGVDSAAVNIITPGVELNKSTGSFTWDGAVSQISYAYSTGLDSKLMAVRINFSVHHFDSSDRCTDSDCGAVKISARVFPDNVLRDLIEKYEMGNPDGILTSEELEGITELYDKNHLGEVKDLSGLELLPELKTLELSFSRDSIIDLDKARGLTSLIIINGEDTAAGGYVQYIPNINGDKSKLISLKFSGFRFGTKMPEYTGFTALESLILENCGLTRFDGSKYPALRELMLDGNNLTSLNVADNENLRVLHLNSNKLTAINVSGNTELTSLWVMNNRIEVLDLSNNSAMVDLRVSNNRLSNISTVNMASLEVLYCANNLIKALDLTANSALLSLDCSACRLTALNLSGKSRLEELDASGNNITVLDVSANAMLKHLKCADNAITALNLSYNTHLEAVDCRGNKMASLELPNTESLTELYCADNLIENLDVSKCPALTVLDCTKNRLTALNLSDNRALVSLIVSGNGISTLDAYGCIELRYIDCAENELTYINLAGLEKLEKLYAGGNSISGIATLASAKLSVLDISGNSIGNLDISRFTALEELYIDNSEITSIATAAAGYSKLWLISAGGNGTLTSLDLTPFTSLRALYVPGTGVMGLDISKCPSLSALDIGGGSINISGIGTQDSLKIMIATDGSSYDTAKFGFTPVMAGGISIYSGGSISGTVFSFAEDSDNIAFKYTASGAGAGRDITLHRHSFSRYEPLPYGEHILYCDCGLADSESITVCSFDLYVKLEGTDTHIRTCVCGEQSGDFGDIEVCSGGSADCTHLAICEKCETRYGEIDENNHTDGCDRTKYVTEYDGTHNIVYSVCNKISAAGVSCQFDDNNTCECGAHMHSDIIFKPLSSEALRDIEQGKYLLLGGNYYLTEDLDSYGEINVNLADKVSLCLMGHSIKNTAIINKGVVEIYDCTTQGSIYVNHTGNSPFTISNSGRLDIFGGTILSADRCAIVAYTGSVTAIHRGTVGTAGVGCGVILAGSGSFDNSLMAELDIRGGTVLGEDGILAEADSNARIAVSGGTVSSIKGGALSGKITITGGVAHGTVTGVGYLSISGAPAFSTATAFNIKLDNVGVDKNNNYYIDLSGYTGIGVIKYALPDGGDIAGGTALLLGNAARVNLVSTDWCLEAITATSNILALKHLNHGDATRLADNGNQTHKEIYICCGAVKADGIACEISNPDSDCTTAEKCICGHVFCEAFAAHSIVVVADKNGQYHTAKCNSEGCSYTEDVPHVFDREIANDRYLSSIASCTSAAAYFKSCICGHAGTESFKVGTVLPHSYGDFGPWADMGDGTKTRTALCSCGDSIKITSSSDKSFSVGNSLIEEALYSGKDLTLIVLRDINKLSAAEMDSVKALAPDKNLIFLDISIMDAGTGENITSTNGIIEMAFKYDRGGKADIELFRYHEGESSRLGRLQSRPNGSFIDGSYYIDEDAGIVYIYSSRFSLYAVAYNDTTMKTVGAILLIVGIVAAFSVAGYFLVKKSLLFR